MENKTIKINLVQHYTAKCETPEEIMAFNEFYDLEEARLKHESEMEKEWIISHVMETLF